MMQIDDILTGKHQLTKEEAIKFAETKWWEGLQSYPIALLQVNQDLMCMDFSAFHRAFEDALLRPVWTHEFADRNRLRDELLGKRPRATMQEIIELIPEEKRILVKI